MKRYKLYFLTGLLFLFAFFFQNSLMAQGKIVTLRNTKTISTSTELLNNNASEIDINNNLSGDIQSGRWIANAATGFDFEFVVNEDVTKITEFKLIFDDWVCGSVKHGGSVKITSNWIINNREIAANITLGYNPTEEFSVSGTFSESGTQASGDWSYESEYGNCSGTWTGAVEGTGNLIIRVPEDYATIQEGIDAAGSGDIVLVAEGIYHENGIQMKSEVVVRGAGIDLSVVDGDSLTVFDGADDAVLEGFTITNASKFLSDGVNCVSSKPIIRNNKFTNCDCGINVAADAVIRNNIFSNNYWAIFCGSSVADNNPQIKVNLIAKNYIGISCISSDLFALNNTIDDNKYGIRAQQSSSDETPVALSAANNIITQNAYYGIYLSSSENYAIDPSFVTIRYNDVWNNSLDFTSNYDPDPTNISENPLFVSPDLYISLLNKSVEVDFNFQDEQEIAEYRDALKNINCQQNSFSVENEKSELSLILKNIKINSEIDPADYYLQHNSPCIDAGDPESENDPDGTRADMGAFPYTHSPNHPPVVANTIPDITLVIDSANYTRNLDEYPPVFSDSDNNDTLSYSASTSDNNIVTVEVSGSFLSVLPVSEGFTSVVVTATDMQGETVSTEFNVEVKTHVNQSPGRFGGCLVFDGIDDYAEASDHDELDLGDQNEESLTIEAWVKFYEFGSADIVSKSNAYRLYTETSTVMGNKTRVLGFILKSGNSNLITSSGTTVYGGGFWIEGWHHVAGVYNNITGELSLYMDGELLSSWEPGNQQINNTSFPLKVGTNLDGCIDEMRISQSPRYTGESYEVPAAPFFSDENTLALWHFDDPMESQECQDCCMENNCLFLYKGAVLTSIESLNEEITDCFELLQNYPNPFSNSTTIEFNVLKTSHIQIQVYDILGHEVKTLINSKYLPGKYQVVWNGKNTEGINSVSGIYLLKMRSGEMINVSKLFLR